jgi:ATP-dependent Clp protease, protease subunit
MSRLLQDGKLFLYGFVGENFWEQGFTSFEVVEALAEHGRDNPLEVHLNSGGGYAHEGISIHNTLVAHKGKVTMHNDAMAASAASIIFMAGEENIMHPGSQLMIHDPSVFTQGTIEEHEKSIAYLKGAATQMAGMYADRIGGEADAVRDDMKAELWMTADEAVAAGYADKKSGGKAKAVAAFEYGIYAKAPEPLKAMAAAKGWSISREAQRVKMTASKPSSAPAPKTATEPEDEIMTEAEKAAFAATAKAEGEAEGIKKGAKAAQERIKAIMTSPEAAGREAQAQLFAYDDKFAGMDAATAIAALTAAPKAEAKEAPELTVEQKAAAYEQDRLKALALPGGKKAEAANGVASWAEYRAKRSA